MTPGQTFTPFLVAARYGNKDLFAVGQPPTPELAMLVPTNDRFIGNEGFVHVNNGFHDLGSVDDAGNTNLWPVHYSWNYPVAVGRIRRGH